MELHGKSTAVWASITGKPEITASPTSGGSIAGDGSTLDELLSATPAAGTTIILPSGNHALTTDRTVPEGVTLKAMANAVIVGTTIDPSITVASTWVSSGTGQIQVTNGSTKLVGTLITASMSLKRGTRIKTNAGNYLTVRDWDGSASGNIYTFEAAVADEAAAAFTITHYVMVCSSTSGLAVGDVLNVNSTYYIVSRIVNGTDIWVYKRPKTSFTAAAATRDARLVINGMLDAHPTSQCFGANLAVRFKYPTDIYPDWWGLIGNQDITKSASNSDAIFRAVVSSIPITYSSTHNTGVGGRIRFNRGYYVLRGSIPIVNGSRIEGLSASGGSGPGAWFVADWVTYDDCALMKDATGCNADNTATPTNYGWEISDVILEGGSVKLGDTPIDQVLISGPGSGRGRIKRIETVSSNGWGIRTESGAGDNVIDSCHTRSRHGICVAVDSTCVNNNVEFGKELFANTTVTSTGWTVTTETPPSAWGTGTTNIYTNGASNTNPLVFTIDKTYIRELEPFVIKLNINYVSAGDLSIVWGAASGSPTNFITSGVYLYKGNNAWYFMVIPTTLSDPTLTITPTAAFNGDIRRVKIYSGIGILESGGGSAISNNICFADYAGAIGLSSDRSTSPGGMFTNNRIGPAAFGVCLGGVGSGSGNFVNNWISSNFCLGIAIKSVYASTAMIKANDIRGNLIAVIGNAVVPSTGVGLNGTTITDNRVSITNAFSQTEDSGQLVPFSGFSVGTAGLMENNDGLDRQATPQVLSDTGGKVTANNTKSKLNSATPDVQMGRNWITGNTANTIVTDFVGACKGKEIFVRVNDAYTILGFGGNLLGNNNAYHFCASGEWIKAVQGDTGKWHCITSWQPLGPPALCAAGTTAGKAKTQNALIYTISGITYMLAATDDLFNCTAITTTNYCKVLFSVDSSGTPTVTKGTEAATQADALLPNVPSGNVPVGVVELGTGYAGGSLAALTFHDFL